ncbi:MAG: hypothetical protein KC656_30350, partial [Myxococcales bacterium]|nr:hypothetical protein [Myxococcales bacterium]
LPGRFGSDVLEPFTSVVDDSPDDRCNWNKAVGYPEVPCVRGAPGTAASWALYGDSHARMYAEALEKRLGARGESFVQLTHASCPVAPGLCSRAAPRCAAFHDLALERMADPAVQTVVVVTRWNLHRRVRGIEPPHCTDGLGSKVGVEDYEARVIERIRALVAMGKRVVVLGGSPELGTDVPYTNAKRFQRGEPALARRREEAVDTESTRFLEALGTDVLLYQPADILCPEGICETHVDHTSWYRDDNHATLPAALLVLDDLMGRLER